MTKQPIYVPLTGSWYMSTDGMSFTLVKRRVVQEGVRTKNENIGQDRYDVMGYYGTLKGLIEGMYRYLSLEVLAETGARSFKEYIDELQERISQVQAVDAALLAYLERRLETEHE